MSNNVTPLSAQLHESISLLNSYFFHDSSSFLSELLFGLPSKIPIDIPPIILPETSLMDILDSRIILASSHFREGDYSRVFHFFTSPKDHDEFFLKYYSLWKIGSITDVSSFSMSSLDSLGKSNNKKDGQILTAFRSFYSVDPSSSSFLSSIPWFNLFLLGLVFISLGQKKEALKCLVRVTELFPFFIEAWFFIENCLTDFSLISDSIDSFNFQDYSVYNLMKALFLCQLSVKTSCSVTVKSILTYLEPFFGNSPVFFEIQGRYHYCHRNFDLSRSYFDKLLSSFPFRLDGIDIYSNLLFISGENLSLKELSIKFQNCKSRNYFLSQVVQGNYYSLIGERKKAAELFLKAAVSNLKSPIPLILLGHELVELRCVEAAFSAYTAAFSRCIVDFRPLYSLGQLFEVIGLHTVALAYYQKALRLNPYDSRIYSAVGIVYWNVGDYLKAEEYFSRSLEVNSNDLMIHFYLGLVYSRQNLIDSATYHFIKAITSPDSATTHDVLALVDNSNSLDIFQCVKWLINCQNYSQAEELLTPLLNLAEEISRDANALLTTISVQSDTCFSPSPKISRLSPKRISARVAKSPVQR
ncbi:hypothetical protein RCL1_002740 [Eukaryota sp. TZLM3-RCL]